MAQGFAQGFASGFGLVSDVFKEKREQERQARGEAFQREQFEEQRRRADVAEARANETLSIQQQQEKRAADEYARKTDMEDLTRNIRLGNVSAILAHPKAGPEFMANLDPKYRETFQKLESGQLNLDNIDIDTANILLAPEIRRKIGEKTRVDMNPLETDPAKKVFKPVTVTNKSIESIEAVPDSGGKAVSIKMLVEGVDDSGKRIIFTDKMTAGRQIGGDEKQIPVAGAIDYITVGKRAFYNLFQNTPAFRNVASAYGAGMSPEQKLKTREDARSRYIDRIKDSKARLDSLFSSDPVAYEQSYGKQTTYEAAEEIVKRLYGGMSADEFADAALARSEQPSDVSKIQRMPNLGEVESRYSNLGMQFKNRDEVIRMKNDEFAAQAKWGDESVPVLGYMINALSARKGQPITFDEYRQLSREIASLKEPITPENYKGVVNTAINNMVRGNPPEGDSAASRMGISPTSSKLEFMNPYGLQAGKAGEEKKNNETAVDVSSIAPAKYAPQIESAANSNGIDPVVFAKLAKAESAFRSDIVSGKQKSSAGAVGIVQMVPKYHPNVDFNRVKTDTQYALNEGARYFSELLNRFGGDYEKAAAAYNWGPTNLAKLLANQQKAADWKKHLPGETKDYLRKIFG